MPRVVRLITRSPSGQEVSGFPVLLDGVLQSKSPAVLTVSGNQGVMVSGMRGTQAASLNIRVKGSGLDSGAIKDLQSQHDRAQAGGAFRLSPTPRMEGGALLIEVVVDPSVTPGDADTASLPVLHAGMGTSKRTLRLLGGVALALGMSWIAYQMIEEGAQRPLPLTWER